MTLSLAVIDSPGSEHSERTTGVLSVFAYESRTRAGKPVIPSSLPPSLPPGSAFTYSTEWSVCRGGRREEQLEHSCPETSNARHLYQRCSSALLQQSPHEATPINLIFHIPNVIKKKIKICNANVSQETRR